MMRIRATVTTSLGKRLFAQPHRKRIRGIRTHDHRSSVFDMEFELKATSPPSGDFRGKCMPTALHRTELFEQALVFRQVRSFGAVIGMSERENHTDELSDPARLDRP